jgi:hypothetical protein
MPQAGHLIYAPLLRREPSRVATLRTFAATGNLRGGTTSSAAPTAGANDETSLRRRQCGSRHWLLCHQERGVGHEAEERVLDGTRVAEREYEIRTARTESGGQADINIQAQTLLRRK